MSGQKRKSFQRANQAFDTNADNSSSELSFGNDTSHLDSVHVRKRRTLLKEKETDIDKTGEQKVDSFGRLRGGREYRVPTFRLPTRDETLFMLSKDPATLLGFRDSFVFLKKNPKLVKVHIDNAEKSYLVDSKLLRSAFRTREVSAVTARSVFKQFGHRVVRQGKKGLDDYYDDAESAEDDDDPLLLSEEEEQQPKTAAPVVQTNLLYKPTPCDASVNDIFQAAVSASQFNASLSSFRASNPTNYDLLSNVYQIPKEKQTYIDFT